MNGEGVSWDAPANLNIAEYFLDRRIAEGRGERVALRGPFGELTYREVQGLANRFAQALVRLGVRPEERVLIALPDGPEYVGALFGVLKAGAVVVMVNPALEPDSLAHLLRSSRARCAVVADDLVEAFETADGGDGDGPELLVCGPEAGGHTRFAAIASELDAGFDNVRTHRDDPAIWLFSGGTTGRPKAVVQTHRSFANTTELYAKAALGYHEDDVTISVPKLYFGYATGSNLLFPFAVGASAVLFPEPATAETLFEHIRRHRATILINVPKMVGRMVDEAAGAGPDLSSLRFATSAGEALPVPLYERWKETFGVELLDGLGTAEMWHIFVSNLPGAVKPGTLGRVVPGFEIEVRDDSGAEVAPGEVGKMWVRGDSRALGYWQDLDKTAQAFRGEWFVGGDLVRRDAEGFVTYCGRGDDVLKVSGKWLAPQEVESCLMKHPAVAECAVVGVEGENGLTLPWAFVRARERYDGLEEELKAFALEQLQAYKHPRRVVVLDEFPRTHLGKIDRGKLKTLA